MSSTRSRRTTAAAPSLAESMARINALTEAFNHGVATEYKAVAKALKDDADRILAFWLADTTLLNPTADFRHRYLLRQLFENCGTQAEEARAYLDTLPELTLSQMGFTRYTRGGAQHYRIRVGMDVY
jgi:hypothetical protein